MMIWTYNIVCKKCGKDVVHEIDDKTLVCVNCGERCKLSSSDKENQDQDNVLEPCMKGG